MLNTVVFNFTALFIFQIIYFYDKRTLRKVIRNVK